MPSEKLEMPVIGMTCANCALAVERTLKNKAKGIINASVNLASETAFVESDPSLADLKEMAAAVEEAGYKLVLPAENADEKEQTEREREVKRQKINLILS